MGEGSRVLSIGRATPRRAATGWVRVSVVLLLALTLLTLLSPRTAAAEQEAIRLRVLTFNAFGVPVVAPSIDERMERMGPLVVALAPDVVAMQEVWRDRDAAVLTAALAAGGLVHQRTHSSPHWSDPGRGGLLIASRFAIVRERFERYDSGRSPHVPWHLDWRSGKGVHLVELDTPAGPVHVVNTHLQASYEIGRYEALRVSQAVQVERFIASETAQLGGPLHPLIFAGDFNATPSSPSVHLLSASIGARPVADDLDIDAVLVRSGREREVEVIRVERVLTEPITLESGRAIPLSDHEGLLVDLALVPRTRPQAGPGDGSELAEAERAAREVLEQDLQRTSTLRFASLLGALGCVLLGLRSARRLFAPRRLRTRLLHAALVLACAFWGLWWSYVALAFVPQHVRTLEAARAELER